MNFCFNKIAAVSCISSGLVCFASAQASVFANKEVRKAFTGVFKNFDIATSIIFFTKSKFSKTTVKRVSYDYVTGKILEVLIDLNLLNEVPISKEEAKDILFPGMTVDNAIVLSKELNLVEGGLFMTLSFTSGKKFLKANTASIEEENLRKEINNMKSRYIMAEFGEERGGYYIQVEGCDRNGIENFSCDSSYLVSGKNVIPFLNIMFKNAGYEDYFIEVLNEKYYLKKGKKTFLLDDELFKKEKSEIEKIFAVEKEIKMEVKNKEDKKEANISDSKLQLNLNTINSNL